MMPTRLNPADDLILMSNLFFTYISVTVTLTCTHSLVERGEVVA